MARRALTGRDEELVFGHPQLGTPLDPSKLSRALPPPRAQGRWITKPFRPWHDLRHTALTHEAAAGNPQAYVQMKAGHSQGSITERYIHAAQVLFPGAAARGEERMFGAVSEQAGPQTGHSADWDERPAGKSLACRDFRSSPGWTRTNNPPVNSRMLCQLSYRGTRQQRPHDSDAPVRPPLANSALNGQGGVVWRELRELRDRVADLE